MEYPEELIKGIPNDDFVDEDGSPASHLFHFEIGKTDPQRTDDFLEQSINWYDDENALTVIVNQKKAEGIPQFRAGAAILSRNEIDRICKSPIVKERLSYERREIPDNKYHGNLLLKKDVPKPVMKKIAASIATMCVKEVIPNMKSIIDWD